MDPLACLAQGELDLPLEHINSVHRLVVDQVGRIPTNISNRETKLVYLGSPEREHGGIRTQEISRDFIRITV